MPKVQHETQLNSNVILQLHNVIIYAIFCHSIFFLPVPNFDITKPKITHLRHARKRRSTELNPETSSSKKLIELQGLGRQFALNVHQNQKLLDPYFVHLHRHENRSEILPTEVVWKQLGCFYHGQASHQSDKENDVQQGAVAISLCGGLVSAKMRNAKKYILHNFKMFHRKISWDLILNLSIFYGFLERIYSTRNFGQ